MKLHNLEKLQRQRAVVAGRYIIGIDPANAKLEAQILNPDGLPVGSSFSFAATSEGFRRQRWRQLRRRLPAAISEPADGRLADHLVFAVEASCNLWPTLVHHLERQPFGVVIVSPLATCHARPVKSGNFSPTDSKDAFLIADLARQGTFQERIMYSTDRETLHRLGITYDKLRKSLQRHYARLRAQLEILFPEFLQVLHLDTLTARHLLRRHLLPEEYLALDIDREADTLMEVSRRQHGRETLLKLQALARQSIGVLRSAPCSAAGKSSYRPNQISFDSQAAIDFQQVGLAISGKRNALAWKIHGNADVRFSGNHCAPGRLHCLVTRLPLLRLVTAESEFFLRLWLRSLPLQAIPSDCKEGIPDDDSGYSAACRGAEK